MAIDYINAAIVSAGRGESALGLGAYLCRARWRDPLTGRLYDFSRQAGDVLCTEVLLPPGAAPHLAAPEALTAAMEAAELIIDRKTGQRRFRANAQLAKHVILALPKELNASQRVALARQWARTQYVDQGAGVLLAVHEADDPEVGNHHAHLLVTTREVGPDGLSRRKARHLNPEFSRGTGHERATIHGDDLPGQWRAFQNAFFRDHDIPLSVDPGFVVRGQHRGKGRFVPGSDLSASDQAARDEACRRIREIPELLDFVTRHASVFSRKSLAAALRRHDVPAAEIGDIVARALADPEVVPLLDPVTGQAGRHFTTRAVHAQERRILDLATSLSNRIPGSSRRRRLAAKGAEIAARLGLSTEQKAALMHCVEGPAFSCIRGVAGAGKSYTVKGIRESLEASGYRVVGLAPTNKVVCSMALDGFGYAATLHLERLRQENPRHTHQRWDRNTCVVVDEAGMVDSELLEDLLARAESAGARVILVGDQAQLASVSRGGMFGVLKDKLGCAEIREIRRQEQDWARAASLDFAQGNIEAGLAAYDARGHLRWSSSLDDSMAALVRQWRDDYRAAPDVDRFVYAATNASVDRLNAALQATRWEDSDPPFMSFETRRGVTPFTIGDRIQIYGNLRKHGIFNGIVGTITELSPDRISFLADGGKELSFDPEEFREFGLGYAGTVYRGQGQTLPRTYALYDSAFSWNRRTTYVALTRHKQAVSLFVPRTVAADTQTLARHMSRDAEADPSICFAAAGEAGAAKAPTAMTISTPAANDARVPAPRPPLSTGLPVPSEIVLPPVAPVTPIQPSDIVPATAHPVGGGGSAEGGVSGKPRILAPMPWRAPLSVPRDFDLALEADRDELLAALSAEPMDAVCRVYDAIRRIKTTEKVARDQLANLRGRITARSRLRGFLPRERKIDRDCLAGIRLDPWNYLPDPELWPGPDETDIRPLVQPLLDVSEAVRDSLAQRLKSFVIEALRNIDHSLGEASRRATGKEDLRLALVNTRSWLYRLCHFWGQDLHPELTAGNGGTMLPPDDYIRDYLILGAKAQAADPGDRPRMPASRTGKQRPVLYPVPHYSHRKDRLLRELYEARLAARVAAAETRQTHAFELARRSWRQENHGFLQQKSEAAHDEHLALRKKLLEYRADPQPFLAAARPIDFVPLDVMPEEPRLRRPGGEAYSDTGPDAATIWLWREMVRRLYWSPEARPAFADTSVVPPQQPDAPQIKPGVQVQDTPKPGFGRADPTQTL